MTLLDQIQQHPAFPELVQKINQFWEAEKKERQAFYNLVHEDQKAEFINGQIVFQSPVKQKHWQVCTNISAYMTIYVNENQLGMVGTEKVMIRCTRNDYEPDIVFFSAEKAKSFTPNQMLFPPPDLAVEMLSKSTKSNDYGIKFQDYASHGVQEYWIVDTDLQCVEQYILDEKQYELHQKITQNGVLQSIVIQGFKSTLHKFFKHQNHCKISYL